MESNMNNILKIIDELRHELQICIKEKGISNEEVIVLSKRLDIVLNQYYQAIKEKS